MGKTREIGDLVSDNLISTDIDNDRVGIGSTLPSSKLDVSGDVKVSGAITATSFSGDGSNLTGIVTSITAGSNISVDSSTGSVTITGLANTANVVSDTIDTGSLSVTGITTLAGNTNISGDITSRFLTIVSTDSGSGAEPVITLKRDSSSPAVDDQIGELRFTANNSSGQVREYASITGKILNPNNFAEKGAIETRINGILVSRQGPTVYEWFNDINVSGVVTTSKLHVDPVGSGITYNEDLVVLGNARVTGILSIGTSSIVLDSNAKTIRGVNEIRLDSDEDDDTPVIFRQRKGRAFFRKTRRNHSNQIVEIEEEASVGIGTTVSVNTSGIITASSFYGDGSNLTGLTHSQVSGAMGDVVDDTNPQLGGNLDVNGNDITGTGNINITGSGTFSGNVSIAGTLTYEDVTNVDSVGLITARSGVDVTGNIAVTGTVDGRDIASDGSKLDGIESGATADQTAAEILTLIKTVDGTGSGLDADTLDNLGSGAFLRSNAADTATGDITFRDNKLFFDNTTFSTFDWQNYQANNGDLTWTVGGTSGPEMELESDGSNYSNAELRVGGSKVWTAGNDGAGSGLDADTLDGVNSGSFLRSDANDSATGQITLSGGVSSNGKDFYSNNGAFIANDADGAFATRTGNNIDHIWHNDSTNAWNFCSDTTYKNGGNSTVYAGAFSAGGSTVWHAGNDGSGSGLDADLLDGAQPNVSASNNTIVKRHSSGYIYANYFNTTPNDVSSGVTRICCETGNDGFIRHATADAVRAFIDDGRYLRSNATDSFTGTITNSGNFISSASSVSAANFNKIRFGRSGSQFMSFYGDSGGNSMISISQTSNPKANVKVGYSVDGGATIAASYVFTGSSGTVWTTGNDGSGSGLDADTVDGIQGASFLRSDANDTLSAIITGHASNTEVLRIRSSSYSTKYIYYGGWSSANSNDISRIRTSGNLHIDSPANGNLYLNWYASNRTIHLGNTGQIVRAAGSNTVWHAGNDGSGSGLDADLLDGINSGSFLRSDATDTYSGGTLTVQSHSQLGAYQGWGLYYSSGWKHTNTNSWGYYFRNEGGGLKISVAREAGTANGAATTNDYFFDSTTDKSIRIAHTNSSQAYAAQHNINAPFYNTFSQTGSSYQAIIKGRSTGSGQTFIGSLGILHYSSGDHNLVLHSILSDGTGSRAYTISGSNGSIWTSGNDGAGSGLDADTVDGISSASFMRSDASTSTTGNLTVNGVIFANEIRDRTGSQLVLNAGEAEGKFSGQTGELVYLNAEGGILVSTPDTGHSNFQSGYTQDSTRITGTYITIDGNTAWHAGNDGSGSGLDADLLDGSHKSAFVCDRGSGQIGTGTSWDKTEPGMYGVTSSTTYTGTNNPESAIPGIYRYGVLTVFEANGNGLCQLYTPHTGNKIALRTGWNNGGWYPWQQVWTSTSDGAGSGLDADTLDGTQLSAIKTNSSTDTNNVYIRNGSPTIYLRDTNHRSSMLHCNSNLFYVLRGSATDSTGWATTGGAWPLIINLENNDITGGRNINAVGDVTAFSSDRRLKENFKHIDSPLEKIKKLNGYNFDWKEEVKELGFSPSIEKDDVGLIAQEVQEVVPQAVAPAPFDQEWNNDIKKNISKSGEDYLTVKYDKLVPLLVEAIKELKAEVETLKAERN